MKKIIAFIVLLSILIIGGSVVWYVNINHAFRVVTDAKVYKSGLIPPSQLEEYLMKNNIKTIVDLLDPGVQDALNPAKQKEIDAEQNKVDEINKKHNTNIQHINIASPQVPTKKTLEAFYEVIDNPDNYPLLIHCYHGMGRAELYSAVYKMEKENWDNKKAQMDTRPFEFLVDSPLHHSSFAKGRGKGDFILNYKSRSHEENSTLNTIKR